MNVALFLQILEFVIANKDAIGKMILALENLAAGVSGPEKGAVIKAFIVKELNIEAQAEAAWPAFAPFFDLFVKSVKAKATPAS